MLNVPAASEAVAADARPVVVEVVEDQREFQVNPRDPSIPSLKEGAAYDLDAEGRKRAIARKRGSYGMALGDILLEGDQTVETITRDLVAKGLAERGFRVLGAGEPVPEDTIRMRVGIREFWAWFSPGFWAVSMEAKMKIRFDVVDATGSRRFEVSAYGINKGQSGREANWLLAYDRAFEDYLAKQRTSFQQNGL